jgi:glycolate oxidase FAD binding subunit
LLATEARALVKTDSEVLEARDSAEWWRAYVARQEIAAGGGEAVIRCSGQPSATEAMAASVLAAAHDISLEIMISPGLGTLLLRARFLAAGAVQRFLVVRDTLLASANHVVVLAADPALKRGIDVWGRTPETIDVMRAIKHEFDPHRVLNPGRFAGHL